MHILLKVAHSQWWKNKLEVSPGPTAVNVVFQRRECRTTVAVLSRPRRGQCISTHLSPSVQVWEKEQTSGSHSGASQWERIKNQSFLTSFLYFLFVGRNERPPLISASGSAWRLFLESACQPSFPNSSRLDALCKTVWLQGSSSGYLYILNGVDLIYRGASHRLDSLTAGLSQVQKPLPSRILLWPDDVQWSIGEGFQGSTQICYLPK